MLDWRTRTRRMSAVAAVVVIALSGCGIAAESPAASTPGTTQPPGATGTPTEPTQSLQPGQTGTPPATGVVTPTPAGPPPTPAGQVTFANWPLYIDIDGNAHPSLDKFTAETGIQVTYLENINDNEEFFGKIQPDLAAGNDTGYDIIVMTDWMIERMIRLGYLEPLDHSLLPNFDNNAQTLYKNPWYDPGNQYSVPWQSGITGIAYNPKLTGRPITSINDLFDPAFAGRVGMFSEMRDTMSLALLSDGVDPQNATIADAQAAANKLLTAAQAGQFRAFYGNDYYDALAAGDLAISMAWSGDISQMELYDNPDVQFVVPQEGGMLWVDNMAIPNKAAHPIDAQDLMNFYYDTSNATMVTEYVGYFSPVQGVAEQVRADAQAARQGGHPYVAQHLRVISQTAFPDDAALANVHTYKILSEDEERQWNDLFNQVING
jgi:spermidine/putrescine transport system substrate-binding protein